MPPQQRNQDPVGDAVRQRLAATRAAKGWTLATLSERLEEEGWPIPVIGLRRIEAGSRAVTVGDLMAFAYVFGVAPIDLLVDPSAADDEPYQPTPSGQAVTVGQAREFIQGLGPSRGYVSNATPSASAAMAAFVETMPSDRGGLVWRKFMQQSSNQEEE